MVVCDVCYDKAGVLSVTVNLGSSATSTYGAKPIYTGHFCPKCVEIVREGEWAKLASRLVTEEEAKAGLLHLREELLT